MQSRPHSQLAIVKLHFFCVFSDTLLNMLYTTHFLICFPQLLYALCCALFYDIFLRCPIFLKCYYAVADVLF